ncbi:MAG: gliding motility-associated C-terminal domain-containing protein [Bacteroidales bacterium]
MKKSLFLTIITNVWLSVICQNTDQQITKPADYIITDAYTFLGIYKDTIAHLVWENNPDPDIYRVQVERSYDSINYSSLASANIKSLLDLHAENYNPYIERYNSILMSSEHGNIRFMYNDVIPGSNLNKIKLWYRVIMYTTRGLSYSSPGIRSKIVHGNQKQSQVTQPELFNGATALKGGSTRACPPLGTPPSGFIICGQPQTQYGACCSWVEQPYAAPDAVSIACGGGSYAWCCDNVPEAPGCALSGCFGFASDPCCVHYCSDYASCSCTPWECCSSSEVLEMVVLQSTPLPGITISGNVQDETCAGLNDGSITITVNNPTPPVNYIWSNGAITQNLTNIPGGNYSVTATDVAGCTNTSSFTVGSQSPIILVTSSTDEHCGHFDGTATVNATGGPGGIYTYNWNTNPVQNTQTAINLPGGTYIVTVTDGACTTTASATVNNQPAPFASITNIIDETCTHSNGGATVTASDGTPGYNYQWNCVPPQYTQTMTGVHGGTYIVTITDANNCTATTNVTITDSPPPVLSILNTTPANCGYSNGSVEISVNGGTQPFQYYWNTVPPQNTQTASGIPAGTYIVTVTDNNSCNATITGIVTQIPGPTASTTSMPEICFRSDGTVTVTANGGYGTYTYNWNTNPPQITQTAINLPSGTYTVTVDDGGCTATTSGSIVFIPGPTAYFLVHPKVLTILDDPVSFLDNSSGNIISWQWTLGDGLTASGIAFDHKYNSVGTFVVTLIVTDNNGCTDTISDTITVKDIFTIYIPSAFTPNGDWDNDYFFPQGINWDPDCFQINIFNRWGSLIYHTNTIGDKWNGTLNNSGTWDDVVIDVYVYVISVKEMEGPKHEYIGRVTLIH